MLSAQLTCARGQQAIVCRKNRAHARGCKSSPLAVAKLVVSPPRTPSPTPPTRPMPQVRKPAPYRVTDATIKDTKGMYRSLLHEFNYKVEDAWVEGSIPKELHGTYFRNGPGMQVSSEQFKRHTFDGDGMILSFSFSEGQCRFKNKFVRTKGFLSEQAAGHPVHRSPFTRGAADGGLLFNPFDFNMKNVANTGVKYWGGKLLALCESGLPHELDPATLDTVGEFTMWDQLATPLLGAHYRIMPGQQQKLEQQDWVGASLGYTSSNGNGTSSANSKAAAAGRTLVGFSFNTGAPDAEMLFYEFAEDGKLAVSPKPYKLPGVPSTIMHDFLVTPDYYVVVAGPVKFNLRKYLTHYITSRCSLADCLEFDPSQPSKVHLVPRDNGAAANSAPTVMDAPPMFTFHHVNAFTTTNHDNKQLLVLDTVAWDEVAYQTCCKNFDLSASDYEGASRMQLRRLVFQLDDAATHTTTAGPAGSSNNDKGSLPSGATRGGRLVGNYRLSRRAVEFPSVNWDVHGEAHSHIYCSADRVDDEENWGPLQSVMKVSLPHPLAGTQAPLEPATLTTDSWDAGPRRIAMEPLFVPRPGGTAEDDGWVLVTVYNAATSKGQLAILDAQDLASGPLATIHMPHFLPAGLHGSFSPQLFGVPVDSEPKVPHVVRGMDA